MQVGGHGPSSTGSSPDPYGSRKGAFFLSRHNACMEDLIPVFLEQRDIEDLHAHIKLHYGPLDAGSISRICYALELALEDTSKADM